jgi:hypothetical protein
VLFPPEPIYHRSLNGRLSGIAAITWTPMSSNTSRFWLIRGWAERDDPDHPHAQRIRGYARQDPTPLSRLGPYVLTDLNMLPVGEPVAAIGKPHVDEPGRDWETGPDGRYVIADGTVHTPARAAIAYAFWRISTQPLATVARPPLDRAARRRAARASITHDTRVVMLRRTSPIAEPGRGGATWHYRVRFIVRGHWRHLTDTHGQPYRVWIHQHIRSVDRTTGVSYRHAVTAAPALARNRPREERRRWSNELWRAREMSQPSWWPGSVASEPEPDRPCRGWWWTVRAPRSGRSARSRATCWRAGRARRRAARTATTCCAGSGSFSEP